jgi:uncharacterized cupin superfamily protein
VVRFGDAAPPCLDPWAGRREHASLGNGHAVEDRPSLFSPSGGTAFRFNLPSNQGIVMTQIVVDHNPTEEKLKELGVSSWSIWEKEVSKFPLDFSMTESAYLLEGEIHVTPQGGDKVVIKAGDFVVFPKGMKSMWEVVKPLRKHYKHS